MPRTFDAHSYFADHADSDAPFVIAFDAYRANDLDCFDSSVLDEHASVADYLLTIPIYEDDPELIEFRDALRALLHSRLVAQLVVVDAPEISPCCSAAVSVDEHAIVYCKRCYSAI